MSKWHYVHWLRTWKNRFSRIYQWVRRRCKNPNDKAYPQYWGRWIQIEWNNIEEFYNDMYSSYLEHCNKYWEKNTTIDRIDVNWNYCKGNCRWATYKEQNNNRRDNKIYDINWEKLNTEQFALKYNIPIWTARARLLERERWNMSFESLTHNGRFWSKWVELEWAYYTYDKLAEITWCSRKTILHRVHRYKKWEMSLDAVLRSKEKVDARFIEGKWIVINGVMYNSGSLAKYLWMDRVTARKRIKAFKEWKMPDYIVLYKWPLPSNWEKTLIK